MKSNLESYSRARKNNVTDLHMATYTMKPITEAIYYGIIHLVRTHEGGRSQVTLYSCAQWGRGLSHLSMNAK